MGIDETSNFPWPDGKQAGALLSFDVDAESGFLFDFPQIAGYLDVLAHQSYGVRTGVPRILRMLRRRELQVTFFVPGYVAERWPDTIQAIAADGHEIAHHGYLHEKVRGVTQQQELEYLHRGADALERLLGQRPTGYRAPGLQMNHRTPDLLAELGFTYDSSLQDSDWPYLLQGEEGSARAIVELPVQFALDDWTYYMHFPSLLGHTPIWDPLEVATLWEREFSALRRQGGLFNLITHPILSGRSSRLEALEVLLDVIQGDSSVWFGRYEDLAASLEHSELPRVWNRPPSLFEGHAHEPGA